MSYIKTTSHGVNICHTDSEKEKGSYISGGEVWLNRFEYKAHYQKINNTRRLKALIREGAYCWPGGYEIMPIVNDGEIICFNCVKENYCNILHSIRNNINDGWRIVGLDCDYGEGYHHCAHCDREFGEIENV